MSIAVTEGMRSLEFAVKGYLFEYKEQDDLDRNWLDINITYRNGEDIRKCVDPCLETWELFNIIEGLEKVLNGERDHFCDDDIRITEPIIRFKADRNSDGTFTLKVHYFNKLGIDTSKPIIVTQEVTSNEFSSLIEKMWAGYNKFPLRY